VTEEQKAYLHQLEEVGYLKQIREFAMARCAPFFWSTQEAGQPAKLLHNGTITYVGTGQKDLGITNAHVFSQYEKDRAELPDVEAQFGGSTIYPEQRLIDRNTKLDLATLDVPKLFLDSNTSGKRHNRPPGWPSPKLKAGELVIYGGYPGALKEPKTGEIVWPFQSFTWWATEVTDSNVVLHVDFPNLLWPGHDEETINENLGGISGGPVFRVIENIDPDTKKVTKVNFELVGIIYEYVAMVHTVRARHVDHVLADGTLRPMDET